VNSKTVNGCLPADNVRRRAITRLLLPVVGSVFEEKFISGVPLAAFQIVIARAPLLEGALAASEPVAAILRATRK
jgi:hypothetical protein